MTNDAEVLAFLTHAMGVLYKNKKARDYILDQMSGRKIVDVSQEEMERIIEEAIEIAQGKHR